MDKDKILEYLKKELSPNRYDHVIGVYDTAIKLAEIYGEDFHKAEIASLLHDCTKEYSKSKQLEIFEKNNVILSEDDKRSKPIWHSLTGCIEAKNLFKVNDEEILNAIKYHTTGRKGMTLLEKIIFISDYIEPGRNATPCIIAREIAFNEGIDKAVLYSLDATIKFLIDKKAYIHKDTIEARNNMILLGMGD